MKIHRLPTDPIITPALHDSLGGNINGPSLIRTPAWLPNALGRYYLYFAHHQGEFIRLAYADDLAGPWQVHAPGRCNERRRPVTATSLPLMCMSMTRTDALSCIIMARC